MKTTDKTKQQDAAHGSIPWSFIERARHRLKLGDADWFNTRRAASPAPKEERPRKGILVPKHLLKGANKLIHESFAPAEAEISMTPRPVGREPQRLLRRFSGKKVIPMNQTFLVGNDDRQIYFDSSNYPYCCIGRVATPGGWGTGTLVGKNFLLTAAHVVGGLWSPGQPLTQSITFVPAMFGGTSSLGPTWKAKVTQIAAWDANASVVGYDMALCRLDQPMGDWLGYFGSRGYGENWEGNAYWEHNGYPYDLSPGGNKPCYQFSVTIDDDDDDDHDTVELETDADIASGQSGGPLHGYFDNGGFQIVGVLGGQDSDFLETSNVFAGGSGLNALVKWGRDNWG
jgi:V8-like Glu-specific endopeptidase